MVADSVTLAQALERTGPANASAMARAVERQSNLTKPPGSLGRLEEISIKLAGIFGTERPAIGGKAVIIAAGDHGVVAQGVTGYPQEVTAQMVMNFLAGGAAISVMSRHLGIRQVIVDAGVAADLPEHPDLRSLKIDRGTSDISQGPAMSRQQAEQCLEAGINLVVEVIESGVDLVATGDMGIGNTTASSAITAAVTGLDPEQTTGEGTGRNPQELQHKIGVVRTSLRPVVVDGFISGAAALVAGAVCPEARDYMIGSHVSAELGHRVALAELGLSPILDMGMRLGEGTGAALAMPIVEVAAATLSEMATFAEAGVSDRDPEDEPAA
ncbi:Nicotinate-nucleotide--dimethylbenzimidazole phosphoribosyltransferase [Geodia barretti]|uniref:Nicotinate-nucleotide--dimethylbenzimidazole phosphoribosyltransferase n=1 Tax=Geodia barretti TaxID=519541 RepID=A0AA35SBF9_GEOBA|nr:Nicotinate-nucleotide--dimethylbenzimidazole phosphoribosyltransferase [Geodia barretti]